MSSRWFWKPVMMGVILFGSLGCLSVGFVVAVISCPGLKGECLSSQSTSADHIRISMPYFLIGGLIGAVLGALFALIRKKIRKNKEDLEQSDQPPIIPIEMDGPGPGS